jgi:membrane associated rhomboid family serine protease
MSISQLRMTRGALTIAVLHLAVSLVYLLCDFDTRAKIAKYIVASPNSVFEHGRVWTIATSPFFEPRFISLLINLFMLWAFIPTMERFWGTPRFYRFFAITSIAGTLAGLLVGLATGRDMPIFGLSPFVLAAIVAFGITHARMPVQFFGVLPLTARQLMFGFLAVEALVIVFGQQWELGAAMAGACVAAYVITSRKWSPGLAWKKWRLARMRKRLSVIEGGVKPARKRDEQSYLN